MRHLILLFALLLNTSSLFADNLNVPDVSVKPVLCEDTYDTLVVTACDSFITPSGMTYTQTGTYRDTLLNQEGCDSIITIHLLVFYGSDLLLEVEICKNTTYNFHGMELSQSGVYMDTLITEKGCDSIVTLDLSVRDTLYYEFEKVVCSNTTYNFNGRELSQSGVYNDTLVSQHGCDSIVTLSLSFQDTLYYEFEKEICENSVYVWNGVELYEAGVYLDTLISQQGCDSIVTLYLTDSEWVRGVTEIDICEGDTYPWNGLIFDETTYEFRLIPDSSGNGCDSFDILILTVHPHYDTTLNVEICQGTTYSFNGQEISSSGTYQAHFLTQYGCDSFVTLNLLVTPARAEIISVEICIGTCIIFNGRAFCQPGSYTEFFTSPAGCDSIVTLQLWWVSSYSDTVEVILCDGEVFECKNKIYSGPGICQDSFIAVGGCDSVIIYKIQESSIDSMIRQSGDTLFAVQEDAEYQWMYCDSQEIAGATDSSYIPSTSGTYSVEITYQGCVDTSACKEILLTNVQDHPSSPVKEFLVYPNPSDHLVKFSLEDFKKGEAYCITDIHGIVLQEGVLENTSLEIGDLPRGIYFLKINRGVAKFVKM